jgi:hypothetical protein
MHLRVLEPIAALTRISSVREARHLPVKLATWTEGSSKTRRYGDDY